MSLTNPNLPVTEARLQEFYERIKPYLGGGYSAGDGIEISNGEISTDNLQSGDMDDVVTPLPAVTTRKEFIKYSTDEQIIGEWIDGKPLYQKTVNWGSLANESGETQKAHNISNVDIFTDIEAFAVNSTGTSLPIDASFINDPSQLTTTQLITLYVDRTNVVVRQKGDRSGYILYVTLRYTKTTT